MYMSCAGKVAALCFVVACPEPGRAAGVGAARSQNVFRNDGGLNAKAIPRWATCVEYVGLGCPRGAATQTSQVGFEGHLLVDREGGLLQAQDVCQSVLAFGSAFSVDANETNRAVLLRGL